MACSPDPSPAIFANMTDVKELRDVLYYESAAERVTVDGALDHLGPAAALKLARLLRGPEYLRPCPLLPTKVNGRRDDLASCFLELDEILHADYGELETYMYACDFDHPPDRIPCTLFSNIAPLLRAICTGPEELDNDLVIQHVEWANIALEAHIFIDRYDRYIEITRNGQPERIILDKLLLGDGKLTLRNPTIWKAHRASDPATPLVVKDVWVQPCSRDEGALLAKATRAGVVNVARYYHHETVTTSALDDDGNVQSTPEQEGNGTNTRIPGGAECRRIITLDSGGPIVFATSPLVVLRAFRCYLDGHKSLYNAGILHRDLSISNFLINEDKPNPSQFAFIIDLDSAVDMDVSTGETDGRAGT
ncbi:hypothetical protein OQA88_3073 [Cercophora sp. LCS_1]